MKPDSQEIVERLRWWDAYFNETWPPQAGPANFRAYAHPLFKDDFTGFDESAVEKDLRDAADHIESLEAKIRQLTEGAIEGWAIPTSNDPRIREHIHSDVRVTGLGEKEQVPARLILSPPTQTPTGKGT